LNWNLLNYFKLYENKYQTSGKISEKMMKKFEISSRLKEIDIENFRKLSRINTVCAGLKIVLEIWPPSPAAIL